MANLKSNRKGNGGQSAKNNQNQDLKEFLKNIDVNNLNQAIKNVSNSTKKGNTKKVVVFMKREVAATLSAPWKLEVERWYSCKLVFRALNLTENGQIAPIVDTSQIIIDFAGIEIPDNGQLPGTDRWWDELKTSSTGFKNYLTRLRRLYQNTPIHLIVKKNDEFFKRCCLYLNLHNGVRPIWYSPYILTFGKILKCDNPLWV